MKKFNWDTCKKRGNDIVFNFLKEVYDIPITEEKFTEEWVKLRKLANKPHLCKRYSNSRGRREYRNLKNKFGFFK